MKILGYVVIVFLGIGMVSCVSNAEIKSNGVAKINGVSLAASNILADSADLVSIKNINANWVALMPYAFIKEGGSELSYNSNWQWEGETPEGIIQDIKTGKRYNLKIMLKPHVWISHGEYTGDFKLETEAEWLKFETSYANYILEFAQIAENSQVEMFCIGTEWRLFVKERPHFWNGLIKDVRNVYTGKITYASNWDEYTETPFWSQLDYIGANAYFPLTEKKKPTLEEVLQGWQPITKQLQKFSIKNNKPILFTEYGYRSVEGTTIKPWESYTKGRPSMTEQEIALQALYKSNWSKPWFAGGFLWKWFNKHPRRGGIMNSDYTPQNKPAELVIKTHYEIED